MSKFYKLLESIKPNAIERLKSEFNEEQSEYGTTLYEFVDGLNDYELEEAVPNIYSDYFGDPKTFRGVVYHQTTEDNYQTIKRDGINASDKTRGISNRSTGAAIFTSIEIDELNSYGDVTLEIDLSKCPDIETSLEEPIEEVIRKNTLMSIFGDDEPDQFYISSSDGLQESTLVVFGHIPPNAFKRLD